MAIHADPQQRTWNSPEQIARHREMSVAERIKLSIAISQAALRFSAAKPRER